MLKKKNLEILIVVGIWAIIIVSATGYNLTTYSQNENNSSSEENNNYNWWNDTNEQSDSNTGFNGQLKIESVKVYMKYYDIAVAIFFDRIPDFAVTVEFKNSTTTIASDTMWTGGYKEDVLTIYDKINLNGSFFVVAYYTYNSSYIFDNYSFNLTSKARLLEHYEDETYYDWKNETEVNPIYFTIENTGTVPLFIDNVDCKVFYSGNHTFVDEYESSILTECLNLSESENITIYPYFYLQPNETYTIVLKFWGENEDVCFTVTYEIKT